MLFSPKQRAAFYFVIAIFLFGILGNLIYWNIGHVDRMATRTIESNNIVTQEVDKLGRQVTTANSNYITKDELKRGTDSTVNTIRKELVGPIRSLERTTKILTTRIEQLTMPVRDTVVVKDGKEQKGYAFNYTSQWVPKMSGLLLGDSLYLDYQLKGGFDLEYHWKKTSLFKPKELSLIITAQDPAVTVDRVQQFQIIAPVPWYKRPGMNAAAGFVAGLLVSAAIQVPDTR